MAESGAATNPGESQSERRGGTGGSSLRGRCEHIDHGTHDRAHVWAVLPSTSPSFLPSSLNPARTPSAPNPPLSCVVVVGDDEAQQPQRQSAQIREMERRAREMLWTTETHAVWEWARKQSTRIILNVTHRQFWKGFFRATEFLIFCFFLLFFF